MKSHHPTTQPQGGFTLLEVLVALTILVTAFVIIWTTFSTTLNAWRRGTDVLTELHHGDFVMEQITAALRSTAHYESAPHFYGFRMDSRTGYTYPADLISFVTTSSAFTPPDQVGTRGLHRVVISIDRTDQGDSGIAVRSMPHLSTEDDEDRDPWFVSTRVKGLRCRIYDEETTTWLNEWEDTNAVPSLVEITLYMDPVEPYDPPIRMQRAIEIPVAPAITGRVDFVEGDL